jgi:hypothetical protein
MAISAMPAGGRCPTRTPTTPQLLADSAADLLAISPPICGMTTAQAKSVGGLAEPAGEVVVQVLLIVADPGDVAVGA